MKKGGSVQDCLLLIPFDMSFMEYLIFFQPSSTNKNIVILCILL